MPVAPSIAMVGVASSPAIVTNTSQTIRITGPQGATARLLQTESALFLGGVPGGGFDIDPFETNKVIVVTHRTVTIGAAGFVDVAVVLTDSHTQGGVNTFAAVLQDLDGRTSVLSNFVVVAINDAPAAIAVDFTGMLAGDYDGSGIVDTADYLAWRRTFGETSDGLFADGNTDGTVDAADYVLWRRNLGAALPGAGASINPLPSAAAQSAAAVIDEDVSAISNVEQSLLSSFSIGPFLGRSDRTIGASSALLVSAQQPASIDASQARDLNLIIAAAASSHHAARERAFTLSDAANDQIASFETEPPETAWALAFEAFGITNNGLSF